MATSCVRNTVVALLGVLAIVDGSRLFGQALTDEEAQEQNVETYAELLRQDIKTQKVAITSQLMELSSEQAPVFWAVYSDYDKDLTALGNERLQGVKEYAANYTNLTNEKADELVSRRLALEERLIALKKKYYERFKQALSPKMAAKFLQIENQLLAVLDLQIASNLPIVQ
jgi:hypothetical protein